MLCKIGTNRTQVLHQMRLRHFARHQPMPDIQITPRERKPDPEVIIEHDELYDRSWECGYEKSTFNSDYNNAVTPNSPETTAQFQIAADETSSNPGTIQESPQKFSPRQIDCVKEQIRIITWGLMRIRAYNSLTVRLPTPGDRSMIYGIIENQIAAMMSDFESVPLGTRIRTLSGNPNNVS